MYISSEFPGHNGHTDEDHKLVSGHFYQFKVYLIRCLFVELMLLLVFFDDGLVSLLKIFSQDDISVLSHSQHSSLKSKIENFNLTNMSGRCC